MKETVYVETSVVSYLTGRPGRDVVRLAMQEVTRDWWAVSPGKFRLLSSELVWDEAGLGDPEAAEYRLSVLRELPFIEVTEEVPRIARVLVRELPLPEGAFVDALHVAVCAVHGVDYLVTWNCRHLANAVLIRRLPAICSALGLNVPVICTPAELMEDRP